MLEQEQGEISGQKPKKIKVGRVISIKLKHAFWILYFQRMSRGLYISQRRSHKVHIATVSKM